MESTNIYAALDDRSADDTKRIKQAPKLKFKAASTKMNPYEYFQEYDKRNTILSDEKEIMDKIFKMPISQSEYAEALQIAKNTYGEDSLWFCEVEAQDIVWDLRRRSYGLKPIMSTTFTDPVVVQSVDQSVDIPDDLFADEIMLPEPIALLCEWQVDKNEWKSEVVSVMKTVNDFWSTYQTLEKSGKETESPFARPLKGNEEKSELIFASLIASGKRRHGIEDDTVDVNDPLSKNISAIVISYNSLFPVWSFVKVSEDITKESKIEVPFIKDNTGQKINEINVNLKDTKANYQHGIRTISADFTQGYIPKLILSFIGGNLPSQVSAIVFSKTIAVNNNTYFKGYRLRILTKTAEYQSLLKCREYLQNKFIQENDECNYSRCVVRINIPKAKK